MIVNIFGRNFFTKANNLVVGSYLFQHLELLLFFQCLNMIQEVKSWIESERQTNWTEKTQWKAVMRTCANMTFVLLPVMLMYEVCTPLLIRELESWAGGWGERTQANTRPGFFFQILDYFSTSWVLEFASVPLHPPLHLNSQILCVSGEGVCNYETLMKPKFWNCEENSSVIMKPRCVMNCDLRVRLWEWENRFVDIVCNFRTSQGIP
jgi:hypothetical protein